jgi:RNA polymerase sigma-70 factor, ECF subfamily
MSLPLSTPVTCAQTEPLSAVAEVEKSTPDNVAPNRAVELVEKIQQREPGGFEELYGLVKNFTFFLMRQLGSEELQDKVHDVFVTVAQAILSGKLRDPERLVPFLTTVTRFYTYNQIERRISRRRVCTLSDGVNPPDTRMNLEKNAYSQQRQRIAKEILSAMPRRDRDVLHRFYLEEQSKEQICQEMELTPTQFRLLKSKAKSTFTELGRRRLNRCRALA